VKVALLIERLDPTRGGAETYVTDFARMLAADGHDVHVFSREDSVVPEGITLRPVKVRGVGRSWRTLSFARRVRKMLSKEEFDIVHGVGWTYSQDVFQPHGGVHRAMLMQDALTCRGARLFAEGLRQEFSPKQTVFRWMERMQYVRRPAAVFIALSEMVKRHMMLWHHVPPESIEVIYNGVDTERFHPGNRETHRAPVRKKYGIDDEVVFLIVAHNFRLKGVLGLVRCVTDGGFPSCRLLVVGRNRMEKKLKAFAESRAPGRVIFTGGVPDSGPYYAAADVYVHPTFYDPCSLVVLEALASGLPVITSTMNGAAELMTPGAQGYVVAPGHFGQLTDSMHRLFETTLRKRMGQAARALAQKHTTRHNYRQMMDVYEKVLGRRGKRC